MAGFQKAVRENVWTKTLLSGPSGSGKTFSALRLATGMAKECGSRIAYIDTENNRSAYYADQFDFDSMVLDAPYSSKKYIEAIDEAIDAGYKVLVIDSTSHEWMWCNETVNAMPGNSFQNWGRVKRDHHNKFAEKVIQSPIHIICTARGKDKWTTEDKNGKMAPKKVGEGIVQEDNTEYNYTLTFQLSQDTNIAACSKDNTHLFEGRYEVLTEKDGENIYKWANSGNAVVATVKTSDEAPDKFEKPECDINTIIKDITDTFKASMERGVSKDDMYSAIAKINNGNKSWMSVKDVGKAKEILELVKSFQ